jgi:hypothetical protein
MTFFFDFFRIPLLLILGAYTIFCAQSPEGDHFYVANQIDATKPSRPDRISPSTVLKGDHRVGAILVSATGGGIHAAGWTAQVLAGLAESLEADYPGQFAPAVRLISAVSGGSVGAMYFLEAYQKDGSLPGGEDGGRPRLDNVVDAAEASSLDEIAYALVYLDQWRGLFPFGWQHKYLLPFESRLLARKRLEEDPLAGSAFQI